MDFSFLSKKDRGNIEKINQYLGMSHRTKPYDFNKSEDIIEASSFITAEYIDFAHYWRTLSNIEEDFDESLEYYYPAAWTNMGLENSTNDEVLDEAVLCIRDASEIFYKLMDRAEERCKKIWYYILLNAPEQVKEYFFGDVLSFKKELVEDVLKEELFEIFLQTDYMLSIEEVAKDFAQKLLKRL